MPSGKMWTQLKRLYGYAEGAGKESKPLVEYVRAEDEKGSENGKLSEEDAADFAT